MKNFIPEKKIIDLLEENKTPEKNYVKNVLSKARELKGLTPGETAVLLQCDDKEILSEIFKAASFVKESIYGKRLVIFAPLYLSNYCKNNCLYCGFRSDNSGLHRKRLTLEEIKEEVESLEDQGQKRLLLVAGEDPEFSKITKLTKIIETIYITKKEKGAIRRLNVNVAPMGIDDFRILKKAGIGTYQLFQETYHRETFNQVHTDGPKSDYLWRLHAMDRAQEAGIDDVGIGALLGLYDYKFEVLALLYHSEHLEKKFGTGPHTISVPRITPALNAPLSTNIPYSVSDDDFKKLVAVIRLAVPYTGMILSTRERADLRDEIFTLGISQISAGSKTVPGAYSHEILPMNKGEQFEIEDNRPLKEVVKNILREGFFPSFCTACYRTGRTGHDFMELAKPGDIKDFCLPNGLLTFKEYLVDYGGEEIVKEAEEMIGKELENISSSSLKKHTKKKLKQIEEGARDLFF